MKRAMRGVLASAILATVFGDVPAYSRGTPKQDSADKVAAIDKANAKRARKNARRAREAGK